MERKQKVLILKDLKKKMVFLTGPRQVGKTWLAKEIAGSFSDSVYLNFDSLGDRKIIKKEAWLPKTGLLILDEIHKMPGWKNYLKGVYDTKPEHMMILVTGSARLETFRHGGDSLAGRYFTHRLLPLSPSETGTDKLDMFMKRGGFPEPFLAENDTDADRWRMQYIDGLIRTDILDFENIHHLKTIHLVLNLLRSRVSSPVSYKSIAEDAGVAVNTVKKYMQILEALYIIFRVSPFSKNIARSIVKEPKIYFFDTGMVEGDEGVRFENMVALSLLKHVFGMVDNLGRPWSLNYLRTKEGTEVDFCLVNGEKPELLIEAKRSDPEPGKAILYFNKKYGIKGLQTVLHLKQQKIENGIAIRSGADFLKSLSY